MSCFSSKNRGLSRREILLMEKLKLFTNKFQNILYPAIIDTNGEIISSLFLLSTHNSNNNNNNNNTTSSNNNNNNTSSTYQNGEVIFPPEYAAYIFTIKSLAEKLLKIFCSSNCSKVKLRAENQAVFNLYCLDEDHVLVFYCEVDPDYSKVIDPTGNDENYSELLNEMKKIVSSTMEIV